MSKTACKKIICEELCARAAHDKDIVVLCSDSRGSAGMSGFFEMYPSRAFEVGIAEQDIVSIAAGMAASGKKPFVFSPASFLTSRSYEQVKVDCAYSDMNVKLIGVSGGVSYGALGYSHHATNDIACMCALPNMAVYMPSDGRQAASLVGQLLSDPRPAYVRVGRNPVDDIYGSGAQFAPGRAISPLSPGPDCDVVIISCGEMVKAAVDAAMALEKDGVKVSVIDMYCLKPFDVDAVISHARNASLVMTVEEHVPSGGLGALVAQAISSNCPKPVHSLSLPDGPVVSGTSQEVFAFYHLDSEGIAREVKRLLGVN